jgi:rare lipoprotein A
VSRIIALLCALLPAACAHHTAPPSPSPHYVLGAPYQAGGVWRYPQANYDAVETGLATVYQGAHPPLTADGEAFDQTALAAADPTLQLPAIARLTDLDTGRQVTVRINDRGPATPHRLIEVTSRTAQLLGFPPSGVARVRLDVLPAESHAAADILPGAPGLAIAAAPRTAVSEQTLAAPSGFGQDGASPEAPVPRLESAALLPVAPPLRLPETVTQTTPDPGSLWVQAGSFLGRRYAAMQRARLAALHPQIVTGQTAGQQEFRVRLGPFATISEADAALDQAIAAGVPDARIVVESDAE